MGVRRIFSTTSPLGRPRWDIKMTDAPLSSRYWIVGRAALMRVSSVMFRSASRGTLKSTRTRTLLPATSISRIVFLFMSFLSYRKYESSRTVSSHYCSLFFPLSFARSIGWFTHPTLSVQLRQVNRMVGVLGGPQALLTHQPSY